MTALPVDPDDLSMLAAEYVLGTLDARAARGVEDALGKNAALRELVARWEVRLTPLSRLALPEAPPPELWQRIEDAIAPKRKTSRLGDLRPSPFLRLWQAWALGATAVAAALALVTLMPQPAEQRMMTVLVSDATQVAWTAEVDRRGGLRLAALNGPLGAQNNTSPEGRVLQMWALPPGATVPTSLGLVPRGSGQVSIPTPAVTPVPGMLIEISLEPPGGSPGPRPSGPVLFIGRLSAAGPST
jgi:anti-sigma-K factor RskA